MPHSHTALPSRRFTVLLLSLLLYIVVYPVLPDAPVRDTLLLAFHTAIIFAGAWVLGQNAKLARVAIPLAVITLAMVWLAILVPGPTIVYTGRTLAAAFFLLTTVQLVLYLARARSPNMAAVLASVCGYLMIAIVYALAYGIVAGFVSDPFSSGMADPDASDYLYFSLVTITTLGYGDIAPIHPMTRSLATTEAVIGQFYVAVIVARLVSLVILEKGRSNE